MAKTQTRMSQLMIDLTKVGAEIVTTEINALVASLGTHRARKPRYGAGRSGYRAQSLATRRAAATKRWTKARRKQHSAMMRRRWTEQKREQKQKQA